MTRVMGWALSLCALWVGCDDGAGPSVRYERDAGRPPAQRAPEGVVETYAGSVTQGVVDGAGEQARLYGPTSAALSLDGKTLFVGDTFAATIRAIDLEDGAVRTVAGRPFVSVAVDGPVEEARLRSPRGMAATRDALFFADDGALRRMSLADGAITTVAGLAGEHGLIDGAGDRARLGYLVHAIVTSPDERTLYLADRSGSAIRAFDIASATLSTMCGGGDQEATLADGPCAEATFSGIGGLALDGDRLYVADTFQHVVRLVDLRARTVTTLAGDGEAGLEDGVEKDARFDTPQGVVLADGALYVTSFDPVLRRLDLMTRKVDTVLGAIDEARPLDGDAAHARLGGTFLAPIHDPARHRLLYVELLSNAVRAIALDLSQVTTIAGPRDPIGHVDGALGEARFDAPSAIASMHDKLYVADTGNGVVREIDAGQHAVRTLAPTFEVPAAIAADEARDRLFVADDEAIWSVDVATEERTELARGFDAVAQLALDGDRLYVADLGAQTVSAIELATGETTEIAEGLAAPAGIAVLGRTLYVADSDEHVIFAFDLDSLSEPASRADFGTMSTWTGRAGESGPADGPPGEALFSSPSALAVRDGALLVADTGNHLMRRVDREGNVTTWLGSAVRSGATPIGVRVAFADATLLSPFGAAILGDDVFIVSDHAIVRAAAEESP